MYIYFFHKNRMSVRHPIKKGRGGIRTHGTLVTYDGFQDRSYQPLWHSSMLMGFLFLYCNTKYFFCKQFFLFGRNKKFYFARFLFLVLFYFVCAAFSLAIALASAASARWASIVSVLFCNRSSALCFAFLALSMSTSSPLSLEWVKITASSSAN